MSNGQQVNLQVKKGESQIEKSFYSAEFNKKFETQCLKVKLGVKGSCVKISWNNLNQ